MIIGLDHIAIAVPDLDVAVRRFVDDLGLRFEGTDDVPSQKTRTGFLAVSGPTRLELVTPIGGAGPIQSALDKRGPGLHHISFRVDDLDADVERLRAKGWMFTTDAPTPGAHGSRVIFVHPKSAGGVLIELSEPGKNHD